MICDMLSRILIAKKQNKKIVKILHKKHYKKLLNLLWNKGFIYGYRISSYMETYNYYKVFLKHNTKNYSLIKRLVFVNASTKKRGLINLNTIEKNYTSFLINDMGFFCDKKCLLFNLGGYLFIKT